MRIVLLGIAILLMSCSAMPPKRAQFNIKLKPPVIKDKYSELTLSNPLKCPLRFYLSSTDERLNKYYESLNPFTLGADEDKVLRISYVYGDVRTTHFYCVIGDPARKVSEKALSLPFSSGKKYKVIQAYNGSFSHNESHSQYSIDFDLQQKDTVCAADEGFVVGVIKDYKLGGADRKWQNYANFITIYHPASGLYTQYVHLFHNAAFVKVGDYVKKGQAIGLAGMTGWTTGEHLHFSVLVPVENSQILKGQPVIFQEQYDGFDLKSGDIVEK